jgi:ubiquitin conjugation factor E4 B
MWESPVHKMAIISESNNGKQFIRFINMMMNDTTFLLDESLSALTRIHEVQEDMEDPAKWAAQNQVTNQGTILFPIPDLLFENQKHCTKL